MRFPSKAFSLVTFTAIDTFGARAFPEICHSLPKLLTLLNVSNPYKGEEGRERVRKKGFQNNNQFAGEKILTSRWTTDGPNFSYSLHFWRLFTHEFLIIFTLYQHLWFELLSWKKQCSEICIISNHMARLTINNIPEISCGKQTITTFPQLGLPQR